MIIIKKKNNLKKIYNDLIYKKIIKKSLINLNIYYNHIKNFDYLEAFHVLYGSKIYELECIPL